MTFTDVSVLGLGRVGLLAASFLDEAGLDVTGYDRVRPDRPTTFATVAADVADRDVLDAVLAKHQAVLSCLPFTLNRTVAEAAHRLGIHYFDLSEDVASGQAVAVLAASARALMAPRCGLAPGFVSIVGASQAAAFDTCRSIRMRVGALPQHPTGLLGYAFNWSPEGVVNQYLNDCEVIEEGERKWLSSLEWPETLYVDGTRLEAFTTSGGLGTMCETFHGSVANVDYKSIRYPGHMTLMNFFFHELLMRQRRGLAAEILINAKPPVGDDIVYVHVSSEGTIDGQPRRLEFVRSYRPRVVAGVRSSAIAWTTAGSVAAVIELVRSGGLPQQGLLKQEQVPLDAFLATSTGGLFDS